MEWTDQELRELASFLARRMTVDLTLLDPTDLPPPGDPVQQWQDALSTARDRGGLPALSRQVAAAAPTDENLQQACELMAQSGGRNTLQLMGAAISVGIFAIVAGSLFFEQPRHLGRACHLLGLLSAHAGCDAHSDQKLSTPGSTPGTCNVRSCAQCLKSHHLVPLKGTFLLTREGGEKVHEKRVVIKGIEPLTNGLLDQRSTN